MKKYILLLALFFSYCSQATEMIAVEDLKGLVETDPIDQVVGSQAFSVGCALSPSILINRYNGTPYIAYADGGNGDKATVKRYDGLSWVNVGDTDISIGRAAHISLAGGGSYIAYSDRGNGGKATVKEYNGNAWVNVGDTYISTGYAERISLIERRGILYIAYLEYHKVIVKRYFGTWENVGVIDVEAHMTSLSLAIDNNGTLYIAYGDTYGQKENRVKKYHHMTGWVDVGTSFNDGYAWYTSLVIDNDGTPYISYTHTKKQFNGSDDRSEDRTIVKKYNGIDWVGVGTPFSGGFETSLAINNNGIVFLGYSDWEKRERRGRATVRFLK